MKTFFLIAHGGLMGILVGELYAFDQWQFWAIVSLSAFIVVMYDHMND